MPVLPRITRCASAHGPATKCRSYGLEHVASTEPDSQRTSPKSEPSSPSAWSEYEAHTRWPAHCPQFGYAGAPSSELDCASACDMLESVHAGDTAAISLACWMWLARRRPSIAMAGAGWPLLQRLHTVRGTTAGQDTAAADTKFAVPSHVQDHGSADLGLKQHATRDAVLRDYCDKVWARAGSRGSNTHHKSAAGSVGERG